MQETSTILLVDDEKIILKLLTAMLMEVGWTAAMADGADEALRMARSERYHMVFVDNLIGAASGMDGIGLIEKLLEIDPELPCVLMTGDLNVDTINRALNKGAAGFLRKPFRVEELLVSIQHANRTRAFNQQAKQLLSRFAGTGGDA